MNPTARPQNLYRLALLCLSASLLLSGCVSQTVTPITNWDSHQQQLAALKHWRLEGKIGYRIRTDDKNHSGSAYFDWQQQPSNYSIHLFGPLGQGSTLIKQRGRKVTLEQQGQPTLSARTPEALMQESLGWWLPVHDLTYWVRGIPAPDSLVQSQQRSPDGTLQHLQQAGWQLTYSSYQQIGQWQLPTKIIAEREQIRLILVLNEWELKDAAQQP